MVQMVTSLETKAARASRPVRCMVVGAVLDLLALGGLALWSPLPDLSPAQLFACSVLLFLFWIGWVVLVVSANYWINSKIFR